MTKEARLKINLLIIRNMLEKDASIRGLIGKGGRIASGASSGDAGWSGFEII